jgi:hypothetical protein
MFQIRLASDDLARSPCNLPPRNRSVNRMPSDANLSRLGVMSHQALMEVTRVLPTDISPMMTRMLRFLPF